MKKIIKSTFMALFACVIASAFSGCKEADPEFVHTDNLINQLFMMTTLQGQQYPFTIDEYDAEENLIEGKVTAEMVEGGYGVAHIEFPLSQFDEIDLTKVYLSADVSYDVIITPGLQGLHDISGDGIVVDVRGGNGKVRKYRIYGDFE